MFDLYWKIVEYEDGVVKTLFHGVNGTRVLPLNGWITARKTMVSDGSGVRKYLSGFHVMPTREDCLKYLKRFKNLETKALVAVAADGLRPKEGSRDPVFLADRIKIIGIAQPE